MYKSKNVIFKSILSLGIIVSLACGIQFKAHAATADQLYVNAYNATANATSTHTQKAINDARAAIELLRNTSASFAIGEFSKQVDQVQQPFLVKIVDSINKAQQTKSQADINAAKAAIDNDLPAAWKNSYSSAVDAIQQGLMKDLVDAYYSAARSGTTDDINKVSDLLDELKLATDPSIGAWADQFTKPMVAVWTNQDVANIVNTMDKDITNLDSYTKFKMNYDSGAIVNVFEDSNKNIRFAGLIEANNNVTRTYYYTNNNISNITEISGDQTTQYEDNIYLKDNKLITWVTVKLSNDKVVAVYVHDSNNLPSDYQAQLAVCLQDGNTILTDAIASAK